jgi:6-pyruvoyltetrahydropterin/6-carboxytetrahydropterin synthase
VYELKIITHLAAAHQLRESQGQCEKLHGHNWKIEVIVKGEKLGETGILVDFKDIKDATARVVQGLDHQFLNELEPFESANPSSENIAHHIFDGLSKELNANGVEVSRVTAWESETACATYIAR